MNHRRLSFVEAIEEAARGVGLEVPHDAGTVTPKADHTPLYEILERDVLPAWEEGPQRWAHLMRAAIVTSARFSGARMLSDYRRFYEDFSHAD